MYGQQGMKGMRREGGFPLHDCMIKNVNNRSDFKKYGIHPYLLQ